MKSRDCNILEMLIKCLTKYNSALSITNMRKPTKNVQEGSNENVLNK